MVGAGFCGCEVETTQGELVFMRNSPKGGARDESRMAVLSDKAGDPFSIEGGDGRLGLSLR